MEGHAAPVLAHHRPRPPSHCRKHSLGLSGPLWGSSLKGPHRVSPVTGVFPAQLSAVISLFPWNPIKAEPKVAPLSLGNTVGLRKIDWWGRTQRNPLRVKQNTALRVGKSGFLVLALLLCD